MTGFNRDQAADPRSETELTQMRADEARRDAVRAAAHASEADRQRGVTWSGMGSEPWRPRSASHLQSDAAARLGALQSWRSSVRGRFLAAVAGAQRAAAAAHLAGESARSALARRADDETDRCADAARLLELQARALLAAARRARQVLKEGADRPPVTG